MVPCNSLRCTGSSGVSAPEHDSSGAAASIHDSSGAGLLALRDFRPDVCEVFNTLVGRMTTGGVVGDFCPRWTGMSF